jgi:hypothetical protein
MAYRTIVSGEVAGATSAKQLPDIDVAPGIAIIKAQRANAGNVYLGVSTVTIVDGTQDLTSGLELDAGEEVTLAIGNLNQLYIICDNAGDDLSYLVMRN